jgi:hypothetical protein
MLHGFFDVKEAAEVDGLMASIRAFAQRKLSASTRTPQAAAETAAQQEEEQQQQEEEAALPDLSTFTEEDAANVTRIQAAARGKAARKTAAAKKAATEVETKVDSAET